MIKKKIKIRKPNTPITRGHGVEELEEDGDFVMDGYSVQIPSGQSKVDIDDLTVDQDDYELQQEEAANGMESDNAEPIAVDRYLRRIR
jgi:hypothetical protein|tara:strand:+ start:1162 stop:1425 length:264 start_codon:yes stop_codon:yes gene_type:complete